MLTLLKSVPRRTAFLASVIALSSFPSLRAHDNDAGFVSELTPGWVHEQVRCAADPAQSYAVYLPSNYTADRNWPILYCFDPMARGEVPVHLFQPAAERLGYIVVGSNNARNGAWDVIDAAARAMVADTHRRFQIDGRRLYAAGFSGGARAAGEIAAAIGLAGVAGCSGGFVAGRVPEKIDFVHFGAVGSTDFAFSEMHQVENELRRRHVPHRLVVFEGGHMWMPAAVAAEALAWFDLQAIRQGTRASDPASLAQALRQRINDAMALRSADQLCDAYVSIVEDFTGLTDVAEIEMRIVTLKKSKAWRRAKSQADKSAKAEETWLAQLENSLLQPARTPTSAGSPPRPAAMRDPFASGSERPAIGTRELSIPDWPREPSSRPVSADTDFFAGLKEISADLRARATRNPAAQRALSRFYVACVAQGDSLIERGDLTGAARYFEAATHAMPSAGAAYFGWPRVFASMGHHERALQLRRTAEQNGYSDHKHRAEIASPSTPGMASPTLAAAPAPPVTSAENVPALLWIACRGPIPVAPVFQEEITPAQPPVERPTETSPTPTLPVAPESRNQSQIVTLEPLRVSGQVITSFGLGLHIYFDPDTRRILRIVVNRVAEHSQAEWKAIVPGDEIISADGRSIRSLPARFDGASEFGRMFIGRNPGDRIVIEVASPRGGRPRRVSLAQGSTAGAYWWMSTD